MEGARRRRRVGAAQGDGLSKHLDAQSEYLFRGYSNSIRGRAGRYDVVDLANAASGVRFFFDGGKYTLARGSQEFRASLNTFIGDILSKVEGKDRNLELILDVDW